MALNLSYRLGGQTQQTMLIMGSQVTSGKKLIRFPCRSQLDQVDKPMTADKGNDPDDQRTDKDHPTRAATKVTDGRMPLPTAHADKSHHRKTNNADQQQRENQPADGQGNRPHLRRIGAANHQEHRNRQQKPHHHADDPA